MMVARPETLQQKFSDRPRTGHPHGALFYEACHARNRYDVVDLFMSSCTMLTRACFTSVGEAIIPRR